MADIELVKHRNKLEARREPYWHSLGRGKHLGYRRTEDGGHWIARDYDEGTRSRQYRALGDLAHIAGTDQFTVASNLASEWFEHLGKGGQSEVITVRDACVRYLRKLRRENGDQSAKDAEGRFTRHVFGDPVATIQLHKLKAVHVGQWRDRLRDKPATMPKRGSNCRNKEAQAVRMRSDSALNRDMTALRAALNLARLDGFVTSSTAWEAKLEPVAKADRRRTTELDKIQRRALLDALEPDIRAFVQGLCLLPLRPGAMAALTVGDFKTRRDELTIGKDKEGEDRTIPVPPATAAFLRKQASGKLPAAPLFARWDGKAWDRDAWKKPIKRAAVAAGLPTGVTAYTLRHSTITDLVVDGLDLFTVAAISGTSVAMIEKYYGKLRETRAREALAGLAL